MHVRAYWTFNPQKPIENQSSHVIHSLVAIQDGQVQIATFASSSRAVPNMGTAPNPWNVFATTDSKVISATKPNAEKIATQQLVFAITHMNVGAI